MDTNFKAGDEIVLIDTEHSCGCGKLTDLVRMNLVKKIVVTNVFSRGCSLYTRAYDATGIVVLDECCMVLAYRVKKVSSSNNMKLLVKLTNEQKDLLTAEDQALLELNVINDKLQLIDTSYVLNFLYKTNKKAIAAQAVAEVAEIKAENAKAKAE